MRPGADAAICIATNAPIDHPITEKRSASSAAAAAWTSAACAGHP
jgi:hypothetical protein